jgi:serine/threonine-protein kinase RsbW
MAEPPNVCLSITNRPENVLLVREMLVGVAEAIQLDAASLDDLRTAVSEVCNNVVLHAYRGKEGPLEVEVYLCPATTEIVVRDHGIGLQPHTHTPEDTSIGLGLPIIGALARRVEFKDVAGGGSEVRMEFPTPHAHPLRASRTSPSELPRMDGTDAMAMRVAPRELARSVLPRVLCVLAAHAHFSTDRINDTQLLADALAGTPKAIGDDHLDLGVSVEPRNLRLRIGPLDSHGARQLIADGSSKELAALVGKLTDDHQLASVGSEQMLTLHMVDRR